MVPEFTTSINTRQRHKGMSYARMVHVPTQEMPKTHATKADRRIPYSRRGKRVIPQTRGRFEEINILTPKQQLCAAQYNTHIVIPVIVNGQRTVAIIDSGDTGNFISKDLVRSADLPTRKKKQQYNLQMADGSTLSTGRVDEETTSLPVAIQRHHEEITFDVVRMATHHVILGMP